MQTKQDTLAAKEVIDGLATKEYVTEEVSAAKQWARDRFARTADIMPGIKALEVARIEDVEHKLQLMRAMSAKEIYVGNLGADDKDRTIRGWI